ncbi:MAG: CHAT domain-containing protein [Leptolyngbyaceae cyanobacterium bins.59]|nr:CHAT domain-containing protein [Leptolyngbyaceae cyanobacterium bins.59]
MIQEFYISVTPVGGHEYLVRTEKVSPGVPLAEEQFVWPVEDWLAQAQHLMNDPVLNLLQTGVANPFGTNSSEPSPTLSVFGQQLYNLLFQGTIRDSWMTAQGIAHHRREGLRLRLGVKGTQLPCLPWEVLYAGNRSIATGTDIVFSRYQPTFTPIALALPFRDLALHSLTAQTQPPLKILMVLAVPSDQESLELKREVTHLQEELYQPLRSHGENPGEVPTVELTILEQPDREQLTQALEQGQYQVLHYAGHSNLAAAGGALYLVSRKTGLTEVLSGDDLAGLLVNNGIRMAVFNSCRGADTATNLVKTDSRERSLAEALVRRGIPAVLAMAERIPNEVALTLTRLFYRNLKQGAPVDLSVSRARQGLVSAYGSQQLYWALPVLYMHPEFDGFLISQLSRDEHGTKGGISSSNTPLNQSLETPVASRSQAGRAIKTGSVKPVTDANAIVESRSQGSPSPGTGTGNPLVPTPSARSNSRGQDFATKTHQSIAALSQEEETDLASLIDDLAPISDAEPTTEEASTSVSDLIRQLSTADEDSSLEPTLVASSSENLLLMDPWKGSPYLDIPANPRDEAVAPSLSPVTAPPFSLSTEPFQSRKWKVKDFMRVRCVSIVQWQEMMLAQRPLAKAEGVGPVARTISQGPIAASSQTSTTPPQHSHPQLNPRRNHRSRLMPLLAGIVVTAIGGVGIRFFPTVQERLVSLFTPSEVPSQPAPKPTPSPSATPVSQPNPRMVLVDQAIRAFEQGKVAEGQKAVETLLNQSAFTEAQQVLKALSPDQANTPEVNFLRGRLIMQAVKEGKTSYKIQEAQQYLEVAADAKPNVVMYSDALGFFYYAIGEYNQANQALGRSILAKARNATVEAPIACEGIYTSCAGLALVLMKLSKQYPEDRFNLIQQAVEYRKQILSERPQDFQPEVLEENWMWSKQAVKDWRLLLQIRTPNPPSS